MKKILAMLLAAVICFSVSAQVVYANEQVSLTVSSKDESYDISDKLS